MTTSSYCDYSDLPTAECDHCKVKPQAEATTPARHAGKCPRCLSDIYPNDIIGAVGDDWLCSRCFR